MADDRQTLPEERAPTWRAYFWPGLVIALLAGQGCLLLVMVLLATADRSFAVEPDYYQKGLRWNEIAAQRHRNTQLGWAVSLAFGDPAGALGDREVRCTLSDREGRLLDGAEVEVIAFAHSRGSRREQMTLEPAGGGVYCGKMRFARKGRWEFRLTVRRGPETFTHTERRDVYPPGESRPWRP